LISLKQAENLAGQGTPDGQFSIGANNCLELKEANSALKNHVKKVSNAKVKQS
jgi:hypothetical protein